jgi:hypothetical protein
MKMPYTIEKMKNNLEYIEGNSLISLNGYAFIDEFGRCIIIVYGENNKSRMSSYFDDEINNIENIINIKYKCVNI